MMWSVPCGRRSARSARRRRRGTPTPRTTRRLPSSSAAVSPPRRPARRRVLRSPAASRRARSSTSAKVPANGRTAECTQKPASGLAAVRLRRDRRGFRASTTPRPRSVWSAQPGFFASRAAAPPFDGDAILRYRECQYRTWRMLDGRPGSRRRLGGHHHRPPACPQRHLAGDDGPAREGARRGRGCAPRSSSPARATGRSSPAATSRNSARCGPNKRPAPWRGGCGRSAIASPASPTPTIAALNGHALGGGAEVAVAADIRLAADDIKIGFNQVSLAIMPAWGGAERLATLVGKSRALLLAGSGSVLSAAEAERSRPGRPGGAAGVVRRRLARARPLAGEPTGRRRSSGSFAG